MATLAAQDSYLQGLARRVCAQPGPEPRKRKLVSKPGQPEDASGQLKKKRRKKPRKPAEKMNTPSAKQMGSNANKPSPGQKAAAQVSKSSPQGVTQGNNESLGKGSKSDLASPSFAAMNLLRQRLHEKIQKASGQGDAKELPPAVLEKRQRRKYERERKKRRRKELKMKAKMEKKETEEVPVEPETKKEESPAEIVFNKVKVHEDNELSKIQKKKEKRKAVKGNITPLTGRNYKQLLSRLETRKNKLEELKDKDQKKAQELENKMKWTNVLYKAEGVKIRDNEERLKEALKHKEKRKAQRKKQWEQRTEKVVERMQQRQEKRRKNIQKKKKDRIEKKKARARKKGRVLPEDLRKAGLNFREATFQKACESTDVNAAEEVGSLPDFVVPEETKSNILERLAERRRGRHEEALTSMYRELACIAREVEPLVSEPGKSLLTKLVESDRKIELLFKKIEFDATLEGLLIEELEELWNAIHQEFLTRKKWIKEMDETLEKAEWSRAAKITDVLRKYTVLLEEISFFLPAEVYRFMNDEAMLINRALLANQRAIAKLFFNLMKTEMEKELSHRLKWQDRVKDWKLIHKNSIVHSFREFMANEEIQNPPAVKMEMENMLKGQILLSERRLEFLQHLCDLAPLTHTGVDIDEWNSSLVDLNKSIDTHNAQCMTKIRIQYEMVQQKCLAEMQLCKNNLLDLSVCAEEEAEEIVNSELLQLTEKLQNQFEAKLEQMGRDFEELAEQNEQSCRDLYSYIEEAVGCWNVHQLKLSQEEGKLQKGLDECRRKQDNLMQKMEDKLDTILEKIRTASSEKILKKYLENALSSLGAIRAKYEPFNQVLMDKVMTYPEAVLQELISYSLSISQYFNVKEIFKQNLQGEIEFTVRDQGLGEPWEAEPLVEQQPESIVQEDDGKQAEGCQQENEEINTAENEEVLAHETEETEQKEDAESIPRGSEEAEHAGQGVSFMQAMFNGSKAKSSEIAVETFSTSSGNTYTVLGIEEAGKTVIPYFTRYEKEESLPTYLEYVLIKETTLVELKKQIRLCFFEHLEKWFAESLSNSSLIVAAKGEELDSELQLHLQLHQQRQENIKKNIYNARAAELLLHKEHLNCHHAGVVEALEKEKAQFLVFCDQQNNIRKNLHTRIREVESVLLSAPMNEKLVAFSSSLHSELQNRLEEIEDSLMSYRNYLTETLGKLRDSNMDFLTACRSFSEGGTFSPEEVKSFSKCIQEENKRIDSFESSIQKDMKKMELRCLQQDTELIKRSETKFHNLFMSRVFMAKIQRTLKNLQVQIKSEVAKSNLQAATLNTRLEKLRQKRDVCAPPTADKEALTAEELYDFAKVVLKELKKRSQYLDCLLEKTTSPQDNMKKDGALCHTALRSALERGSIHRSPLILVNTKDVQRRNELCSPLHKFVFEEELSLLATDVILQGPIAVAIRKECLRDKNKVMVMGLDPDKFPVLSPSRMGKSALNDLSISVIKNLLEIEPARKSLGLNLERKGRSHSLGQTIPFTSKKSCLNVSDQGPQKSATRSCATRTTKSLSVNKKTPRRRMRKYTSSVLGDERFQIFGEKPPESDTFKGAIMNILWTGNNNLLCLAEEFYQKEMPPMVMPEDLPETLERCAEMFKQSLLSYQSQTDNYYNSCLMEFQDQLKLFERELPYVSRLAVDGLFKEHEQKLSYSTGRIRHLFNKQLEVWKKVKAVHKDRLHPSLGHPDNLLQLDTLCQEERKRQKAHTDGVHLNTQMLQDCAAECAQNFVSALAAFTEKLLLELDESIPSDDVQVAKTEIPREEASTLICHKQARIPLDICEAQQLTERGSRTWPGIPTMTLPGNSDYVLCRETASVTTAKTTLGHVAAVEARDAVYEKYKCKLEQQFAQIKEESAAQLLTAQRWEDWWKRSIRKIKQLYT